MADSILAIRDKRLASREIDSWPKQPFVPKPIPIRIFALDVQKCLVQEVEVLVVPAIYEVDMG